MDVEVLKKINSLAKTLHMQGLASNMDDATRLASCMVGNKHTDIDDFTNMAKNQMSGEKRESQEGDDMLSSGQMVVSPKRVFAEEHHPTISEQMMGNQEPVSNNSQVSLSQQQITHSEITKIKYELETKINQIFTKTIDVETNTKNNFGFIKQIGDEIDKINAKLKEIEKRFSEMGNATTNQSQTSNDSVQTRQEQSREAPKEQSNARTGDAKPGEFDIRKYFYSGSDK